MINQTREVSLPGYVDRAITSRLARTEPYSWLGPEQWRHLAKHVFEDEMVPRAEGAATFLQRGTQNAYGHGRGQTLKGILYSAIGDHKGAESHVPHYGSARTLYELVKAAEDLGPTKFTFVELRE